MDPQGLNFGLIKCGEFTESVKTVVTEMDDVSEDHQTDSEVNTLFIKL
jgi:hypothetical protein